MKFLFWVTLTLCLAFTARAQTPDVSYSPEQLDQLLGPIALYPDPLVALILPASTVPTDVTLAARYLAANGAPRDIDLQTWDPSVKALARYPEVVAWMNDNLEWTQTMGAAFAQQASDVMRSIQQLRAQARANGTLVNTPQQLVVLEGDNIRIVPAQEDTIYVPAYDPTIVYVTSVRYSEPLITFGRGFAVGIWLGYECDWDDYGIWVGPWSRGWAYRRDWSHSGSGANRWRSWRPDPFRSREIVRNFYRPEGRLPNAGIMSGYHGPIRKPSEANHPSISRPLSRPDYRGRALVAPSRPGPASDNHLFGAFDRGTQAREFSNRGQASRAAPVRTPPAAREAPQASKPQPAHSSSAPSARGPAAKEPHASAPSKDDRQDRDRR